MRRWTIDIVILIFIFLLSLLFAKEYINFNVLPIEDAAMLMRYAEHFANGYGIVWNIGEPPVDGATDFLFMVVIGLLTKAGTSLEFATRFISLVSYVLMIGAVYLSSRMVFDTPRLIAFGTSLFVLAGPGFFFVTGYFGTTFFALFAVLSWWAALTIIEGRENQKTPILFSALSLITGLVRPEGVILTGLMMLAIVFIKGWKDSRYTIFWYFGIFLLIGGAYFLWRWHYFGYPLPNPYYKKGGGQIYLSSLKASYVHVLNMCFLLLPAFIAGLFFRKTFRKAVGFLIPIIGFTTCFILLSNNTNVSGRFQYSILPIASMVCWPLSLGIREWLNIPKERDMSLYQKLFYLTLVVILFSGAIYYQFGRWNSANSNASQNVIEVDGKYTVAVMLSEYKNSGLRLATSEAGLLPLYSQFRSLDTWGLNDQWIAHHGGITEDYLRSFDPHLIIFHAFFSPVASSSGRDDWYEMTMVLKQYAETNRYILAASFGLSPYDTEYYYVAPNFAEGAKIVNRIREANYYIGGMKATNYALK